MLSTSVWNLSDFWQGVERASIYLMMFLAVAMLVLPLVQPQESEASLTLAVVGIELAVAGIAITIAPTMCGGSTCSTLVGSGHLVTCYAPHGSQGIAKQYYICNAGETLAHGACDQN